MTIRKKPESLPADLAPEGKPTPGPWTLDDRGYLLGPDGEQILVTGVRLLFGGTPAEKAEAAANTRLLASAPDMLVEIERLKAERDALLDVLHERTAPERQGA